jgi:hypothetical protein
MKVISMVEKVKIQHLLGFTIASFMALTSCKEFGTGNLALVSTGVLSFFQNNLPFFAVFFFIFGCYALWFCNRLFLPKNMKDKEITPKYNIEHKLTLLLSMAHLIFCCCFLSLMAWAYPYISHIHQ